MNKRIKCAVTAAVCGIWIFGLSLLGLILPDGDVSLSERRKLAVFPKLSAESLSDGSFTADFEKYSADQFPLRDGFRRIKAVGEYFVFGQTDSNGIYLRDGYASKLEYPLNPDGVGHVAERMGYIYDTYLKDSGGNIYLSIIPDKNYFMADGIYPKLDYDELVATLREGADFAEYIDIFPCLGLSDYYRTDTHWRQERITGAAKALAAGMGVEIECDYEEKALDKPFYGVYCGQSALPLEGEEMIYLDSEEMSQIEVYNAETGASEGVYVLENAGGSDPYEIFLDGPRSLMTLTNPSSKTDRELILFRDSFGSSIAPLLAEGYRAVTLIDIRYLPSPNLKFFVDFEGKDVLFLYSTLVINNGETMR